MFSKFIISSLIKHLKISTWATNFLLTEEVENSEKTKVTCSNCHFSLKLITKSILKSKSKGTKITRSSYHVNQTDFENQF